MHKSKFVVVMALSIFLIVSSCQKANGPAGDKDQPFKGCFDQKSLTRETALEYLRILLKGDSETISFYKEYEKTSYLGRESIYQMDICSAVDLLSLEKDKEAYDLILKVIKQKAGYPRARVCAIRAIMLYGQLRGEKWHGDKRSVQALKELVKNADPDIRLYSAGALLSLGEGDIALPVLEAFVKQGGGLSIPALMMLFSPERQALEGTIKIVRSDTRFFDDRGRDIFIRALDYSNHEVRIFAAVKLFIMGVEKERAEETAIDVLNELGGRKRAGYKQAEDRVKDRSAVFRAMAFLGKIGSKAAVDALKVYADDPADKALQQRALQVLEAIEKK